MKRDNKTIDLVQEIEGHVSIEELNILYKYHDGQLISRKTGKSVGSVEQAKGGYTRLKIRNKKYYRHRLIWMMHYGYIPEGFVVNHKDNDRTNDTIENLRLVNNQENAQNRRSAHKNALVGMIGVSKCRNKFRARIMHDGKEIYIGLFASPLEAHQEYIRYKKILHKGFHHA